MQAWVRQYTVASVNITFFSNHDLHPAPRPRSAFFAMTADLDSYTDDIPLGVCRNPNGLSNRAKVRA